MPLALLALLIALRPAQAADTPPQASASADAVTVSSAGQSVSLALATGKLTLTSPFGEQHFSVSILHGDGWAEPAPAVAPPQVANDATAARAAACFPVPGDREFSVELEATAGVPIVFVTTRLRHLHAAGSSYYYWSSDLTAQRYTAPVAGAPRELTLDPAKWDSVPGRDWLFFPGASGGTLVLPTNVSGRAPGEGGNVFLHALPRSWLVAPGEPHEARFGLAGVHSASEAQAAWEAAHDTGLLARRRAEAARPEAPVDYGRPAPEWLRDVEVYNLYYRPASYWTQDVVADRLAGFPLISGSTPDVAALDKCHRAGVRLLHYVVYTCLLETTMQVAGGREVYSEWLESVDNENRDLKDHPDWVCVDEKGSIQKDAWGQSFNHPGLLNTCLHQPGLQEAAERQVGILMQRGYDGVFVDLAGPTVECYGPEFGRHTHPDGDRTNTQAYEDLLRRIHDTVKSYGDDRIVVHNTCTGVLQGHWAYCDAQMLEAWPYNADGPELRATPQELQWVADRNAEAVAHGKLPVLLPYFGKGTTEELREAALFSAAYARLNGFPWADALTLLDTPASAGFARELYAARLDRPTGSINEIAGVQYRAFSQGLAVLNPGEESAVVDLAWPEGGTLRDVARDRTLAVTDGRVHLELAPRSGRVLLAP
jgi:hypothetical protein